MSTSTKSNKAMTTLELTNMILELQKEVKELKERPIRDRGPKSTKDMTEEDAKMIMIGDLKDSSHKECATKLGLSYGQVYSARNGFTFKKVYKEMKDLEKA